MWGQFFWGSRYFAARYWPKVGLTPVFPFNPWWSTFNVYRSGVPVQPS